MARRTYGDLFTESLEEQITAGGDLKRVVTAVLAYSDVVGRFSYFREWLSEREFTCVVCAKTFSPPIEAIEDEDEYVVCQKCQRHN